MRNIVVSLSGAQTPVIVESGTLGIASRLIRDFDGEVADAEEAAAAAEAAKVAAQNAEAGAIAATTDKADKAGGGNITLPETWRENLGLGDSATLDVGTTTSTVAAGDDSRITGAAQKASNLSDLANAETARGNLDALKTDGSDVSDGETFQTNIGLIRAEFDSVTDAEATTIQRDWVRIEDRAADFKRVGSQPSHSAWFQDAADEYFELEAIYPIASQFGDMTTAPAAAINAMIEYCGARGIRSCQIPGGDYEPEATITVDVSNLYISGYGAYLDFEAGGASGSIQMVGSVGSEIQLSAGVTSGDTTINTATAHGFVADDLILLKGQRNALSSDAGTWQLGLPTGSINAAYFGEPVIVRSVTDTDTFVADSEIIFPDYNTSDASETDPYARAYSTLQKITPVRNTTIAGLRIKCGSANTVRMEWVRNCWLVDCDIDMHTRAGSAVQLVNAYKSGARNVTSTRFGDPTGALYNCFKQIGCWYCTWDSCTAIKSAQSYDNTYEGDGHISLECEDINCRSFFATFDGMTTHGGAYGYTSTGFRTFGCPVGMFLRTRKTRVTGARLFGTGQDTDNDGIELWDGFAHDSLITDVVVENFYRGISLNDGSSSGDGFEDFRVTIDGAVIVNCFRAINVEQRNARATNIMSQLVIRNITVSGVANRVINIGAYINGGTIKNVNIRGFGGTSGVIVGSNAVRWDIEDIKYDTLTASQTAVITSNLTDTTTFPAATYPSCQHNIGLVSTSGEHSGTLESHTTLPVRGKRPIVSTGVTTGQTLNFNQSDKFDVTLAGNITLGISGGRVGDMGYAVLRQDGTGSRTVTFSSPLKFVNGADKTLSTAANAVDILRWRMIASSYYECQLLKGFA